MSNENCKFDPRTGRICAKSCTLYLTDNRDVQIMYFHIYSQSELLKYHYVNCKNLKYISQSKVTHEFSICIVLIVRHNGS